MNRKQVKITGDLMRRTLHGLDEIGLPYAVVLRGCSQMWTNTDPAVALDMMRWHLEMAEKIREATIERLAERHVDGIE